MPVSACSCGFPERKIKNTKRRNNYAIFRKLSAIPRVIYRIYRSNDPDWLVCKPQGIKRWHCISYGRRPPAGLLDCLHGSSNLNWHRRYYGPHRPSVFRRPRLFRLRHCRPHHSFDSRVCIHSHAQQKLYYHRAGNPVLLWR